MSLHTNFHQDWRKNKIPLQRGTLLNLKNLLNVRWKVFLSVSLTTDDALMAAVGRKLWWDEEQEANIAYTIGLEVKDFKISI